MKVRVKMVFWPATIDGKLNADMVREFEKMVNEALIELGESVLKVTYRSMPSALTAMVTYKFNEEEK